MVHAAVVLVPLAFAAFVVAILTGRWKGVVGGAIAAVAVAGAFFAVLAASSGESLEGDIRSRARAVGARASFHDHPGYGSQAEWLAIAFAVAVVATFVLPLVWNRAKDRRVQAGLMAVTALIGVGATGLVIMAGHTGAKLVWKDTGNFVSGETTGSVAAPTGSTGQTNP